MNGTEVACENIMAQRGRRCSRAGWELTWAGKYLRMWAWAARTWKSLARSLVLARPSSAPGGSGLRLQLSRVASCSCAQTSQLQHVR